jgi:membrane protein YqaA with SNARE-associated domain
MFNALRRWLDRLIHGRHTGTGVFLASMAETTFVPIPIEVILIPLMVGDRRRAPRYALLALAGCLVGASIGYLVGLLAWQTVGQWFIDTLGLTEDFSRVKGKIEERGFWHILLIAVSPVPFQLAYVGAGVLSFSYPLFMLASSIGRGVRYFGLYVLVLIAGKAAGPWLDRHGTEIGIAATLVFILGYVLVVVVF